MKKISTNQTDSHQTLMKFFDEIMMIIIIIHYIGSKWSALMNIKKENKKEDNLNWPYIPDHPYRILIIGAQEQEKQMHY